MNVGENTEKGHFFSAVWNAAGAVIHSDPCQGCFAGLRFVKACLARACCPRPPANYPIDMRQPLLTVAEQGSVTNLSCLDHKSAPLEQIGQNQLPIPSGVEDVEPWSFESFPSVPYESLPPLSLPPLSLPHASFPDEK